MDGRHAAPSKAQQAPLAAYNPEPHRASEARGFAAANPAANQQLSPEQVYQQQQMQQNQAGQRVPKGSPGLAAGNAGGGGGNMDDSRARAEKMVNAEREARGKMPVYEGLPDQFRLELKMGE